jgi:uncharacterized lipoprotein YajG
VSARFRPWFTRSLGAVAALLFSAGCSRPTTTTPEPAPKERGVAQTVVEGVTGYDSVRRGEAMKAKIRDISAEHDAQMSAILNEKDSAEEPAGK